MAIAQGNVRAPTDALTEFIGAGESTIVFVLEVVSKTILPPINICGFSIVTYYDPKVPGVMYYV